MNYHKKYLYLRVVKTKKYLDHSFAESISLNAMIAEAHISKYHFIRLFKQMYGMTPHQYLISVRLQNAKHQLKWTDDSISKICYEVGFDSVSSFCNLFKRITSQTPTEFRNAFLDLEKKRKSDPLSQIPGCFTLAHKLTIA